jgi:hypothetical protein
MTIPQLLRIGKGLLYSLLFEMNVFYSSNNERNRVTNVKNFAQPCCRGSPYNTRENKMTLTQCDKQMTFEQTYPRFDSAQQTRRSVFPISISTQQPLLRSWDGCLGFIICTNILKRISHWDNQKGHDWWEVQKEWIRQKLYKIWFKTIWRYIW